jgi:hypothetical protein
MEVLGPGGVSEGTPVNINGNTVTNINFTPGPGEGGPTQVIISANSSYPQSTGTATLIYSLDQAGSLKPGEGKKVAIKYPARTRSSSSRLSLGSM